MSDQKPAKRILTDEDHIELQRLAKMKQALQNGIGINPAHKEMFLSANEKARDKIIYGESPADKAWLKEVVLTVVGLGLAAGLTASVIDAYKENKPSHTQNKQPDKIELKSNQRLDDQVVKKNDYVIC